MTETQKRIAVVDVPGTATAEEAEQLLNAACDRGYYVLSIVPGLTGVRAFLGKRRDPKLRGKQTDGRHGEAMAIIKAHPRDSIRKLVGRLAAVGIKRGRTWVSEKRMELLKADSRG